MTHFIKYLYYLRDLCSAYISINLSEKDKVWFTRYKLLNDAINQYNNDKNFDIKSFIENNPILNANKKHV